MIKEANSKYFQKVPESSIIFILILITILSSILLRVINDLVNYTIYTMTLIPIQNLATAIEQMTPKNLLLRVFFSQQQTTYVVCKITG